MRQVHLVVFGLTMLAPAVAATAGPAEPQARSVLSRVTTLEQPVTYTEVKIPLGELVAKVAQATGVALTASREVADEPVAVVVKEFPARELLEQLADLLDYRWRRSGKEGEWRYEVYQDLASRQREEALRERLFAAVEERLRERIEALAEVATLPPAQRERLAEELRGVKEQVEDFSPAQRRVFVQSRKNRMRAARADALQKLQSPVQGTLARLVVGLPEAHWARLREGVELTFSTDPQRGELRLPEPIGRLFRDARPTMLGPGSRLSSQTPERQEELRRDQQRLEEAWAAATGFRVTVRLRLDRVRTQAFALLEAGVTPFRSGRPLQIPLAIAGAQLGVPGYVLPSDLFGEGETPEQRAAWDNDPVLSVKQSFQPDVRPRSDISGLPTLAGWQLTDLLPPLARTYHVPVISDAYWSASPTLYVGRLPAGPIALFELLERASGGAHHWDRQGRLIRLRSRRWFLERAREVPLRLVRQWKAQVEQQGALPMRAYTEMVTTLSDPQLETLKWVSGQVGLPPEVGTPGFFDVVRLYAALSPAQQQALWRGASVSLLKLSNAQRALFLKALRAQTGRRPTEAEQIAAGAVALRTRPMLRTWELEGQRMRVRDDPLPPGAQLSAPAPVGKPDGRRLYPVLAVTLILECGPELHGGLDLIIPLPSQRS